MVSQVQKSEALTKKVTRSRLIVYRFKKNKAGVAGSLILLIIVLSAIFAPKEQIITLLLSI